MVDPVKPEDEPGLPPERAGDEGFVSRWSRLKRESSVGEAEAKAVAARAENAPGTRDGPPPLPPVDQLTPDSDFSPFMHPKADPAVRRVALRKLFSDPHFNVMDGLDVYIDDYNKFEPIGEELLANLSHSVDLLRRYEQPKPGKPPEGVPAGPESSAVAESGNGREQLPEEVGPPPRIEAQPGERIEMDNRDSLSRSDPNKKAG